MRRDASPTPHASAHTAMHRRPRHALLATRAVMRRPTLHASPTTCATMRRPPLHALLAAAAVLAALLGAGCATVQPAPIAAGELAEAQTFPYFKAYWAGPRFGGYPLAATDGRKSYQNGGGESVYYGDCVAGKSSALGSSGCELPLQVRTAVYTVEFNAGLGQHRNALLRGVPAAIFDGETRSRCTADG